MTAAGLRPGGDSGPIAEGATFEAVIGRIVTAGTYLAIVLIGVGVALAVLSGRSPLDPAPPFSIPSIGAEIGTLRARGFLWLGLIVAIATPPARVLGSLVGYVRQGERPMAIVAIAILVVIGGGVGLALATGSGLR